MPEGSRSASATTSSIGDSVISERGSSRSTRASCHGSCSALVANSRAFSRRSVSRSMSANGVGTWSLTTRIICSGVMPLAAKAATSEPALVPT